MGFFEAHYSFQFEYTKSTIELNSTRYYLSITGQQPGLNITRCRASAKEEANLYRSSARPRILLVAYQPPAKKCVPYARGPVAGDANDGRAAARPPRAKASPWCAADSAAYRSGKVCRTLAPGHLGSARHSMR